jgi:hypothetical protein
MSFDDFFLAERTMQMRVDEELSQADGQRLVRLARPRHRPWLFRQGRLVLCELGYLLVVLGARLEEYGLPPSQPLKGELSNGT